MSDERQKQELRELLKQCFKAAAKYASSNMTDYTDNQSYAIESIEANDSDFENVLENMVSEAEDGSRVEEATEFYQEFLDAISGGHGDDEQHTHAVLMLDEYRLNF